eukprot:g76013.t1
MTERPATETFASLLRTWKSRAGGLVHRPECRPGGESVGRLEGRPGGEPEGRPRQRALRPRGRTERPGDAEGPQLRAELDRLSATTEVLVRLVRELTFHRAYQVPVAELQSQGVELADGYRAAVNVLGACVDVEVRGLRAGPGLLFALPVWARPVDPTPAPIEAVRLVPASAEGVRRWHYVITGRLVFGTDGAVVYEHLLSMAQAELWEEGGGFDAQRGLSARACFPRRLGSEMTAAGQGASAPGL